jgi:hypothetical protein
MKGLSKSEAVETVLEIIYIMQCIHDGDYKFAIGRLNDLQKDLHEIFELNRENYQRSPLIKEVLK